jgi:hypothetical protein
MGSSSTAELGSNLNLFGSSGAVISGCGRYRYHLWRSANEVGGTVLFVLLNPSVADAIKDDPTITRCQVRAAMWGFSRLEVVNLYALRSTDPAALAASEDPVGPDNDRWILESAARADLVICGWGNNALDRKRPAEVLALIRQAGRTPCALQINADGSPAHPLYLSYALSPSVMKVGG